MLPTEKTRKRRRIEDWLGVDQDRSSEIVNQWDQGVEKVEDSVEKFLIKTCIVYRELWCAKSGRLSWEWCNDIIREVRYDVTVKMRGIEDGIGSFEKKKKKGRLIDFCFFLSCSRICIYSDYCYYCCCLNTWIKEVQLPVREHWNCHGFSSILFRTYLRLIWFQYKKGIDA